jgi:hypothetical protein
MKKLILAMYVAALAITTAYAFHGTQAKIELQGLVAVAGNDHPG